MNRRLEMNENKPKTNLFEDSVFATLMDMFGDSVAADLIQDIGKAHLWNLDSCIEELIEATDNCEPPDVNTKLPKPNDMMGIRIAYQELMENGEYSDDADVLIESEEVQSDVPPIELEATAALPAVAPLLPGQPPQSCSGTIPKTQFRPTPNIVNFQPVQQTVAKPHQQQIARIADQLNNGFKVMIIMRGAPGSGKSYLARDIVDMSIPAANYSNHIFSSDDFFYDRYDRYRFDPYRLPDAHEFNQKRVAAKAASGWSPIVVDNTHVRVWEMYAYFMVATTHGYVVEILEPSTPWARSAGKLAQRNKHNVSKDKLEKMLQNYEPATVDDVMRIMKIQYTMPVPQLRSNPIIKQPDLGVELESLSFRDQSSPAQTIEWGTWKTLPLEAADAQPPPPPPNDSLDVAVEKIRSVNNDWVSYDRNDFWKINDEEGVSGKAVEQLEVVAVKSNNEEPNIMSILKADLFNASEPMESAAATKTQDEITSKCHRKDCQNENDSFAQIRQIYPSVPLAYLWDLFKNCNGDGDWTMDILLKEETRISDYTNIDVTIDDFVCNCDDNGRTGGNGEHVDTVQSALPPASPLVSAVKPSPTNARLRREKIPKTNRVEMKRQIEGNFVIADEHYSEHTRKIRNIRLGLPAGQPTVDSIEISVSQPIESNCMATNNVMAEHHPTEPESSEEMLELNLGIELIGQLDNAFGIDAFQRDSMLQDMKTTVFMPKMLAQQLYAIWMESLYNQLEEQRQRSVREDEEFARQINEQQNAIAAAAATTTSSMGSGDGKTNIQELVDMELAWAAYRKAQTDDDWQSPQDLATKMTRTKLFETFPNIANDTLTQVLAANNNNYANAVAMLKHNGAAPSSTISAEKDSRKTIELMEKAKIEVESAPAAMTLPSPSTRALELKKLGPVELKRVAIRDFEDSRNKAMHHTQLKAECYTKAKDAIQKGHTSVAVYYSQIANLHKNKIDMYNNQAANCIMEVHNLTNNNPDMLDLHYLHVVEAIQCLDIFIDKHIDRLRALQQSHKHILVITGRGLHSAGGFSTIKQRTKFRLRERSLTWNEVNPGLLRIKIFCNSRLTMNL